MGLKFLEILVSVNAPVVLVGAKWSRDAMKMTARSLRKVFNVCGFMYLMYAGLCI